METENIYESIGADVKKIRMKRKLTQGQLADKVGTHQPVIANLEAGKSRSSLSFLKKVSEGLGTTLKITMKAK